MGRVFVGVNWQSHAGGNGRGFNLVQITMRGRASFSVTGNLEIKLKNWFAIGSIRKG